MKDLQAVCEWRLDALLQVRQLRQETCSSHACNRCSRGNRGNRGDLQSSTVRNRCSTRCRGAARRGHVAAAFPHRVPPPHPVPLTALGRTTPELSLELSLHRAARDPAIRCRYDRYVRCTRYTRYTRYRDAAIRSRSRAISSPSGHTASRSRRSTAGRSGCRRAPPVATRRRPTYTVVTCRLHGGYIAVTRR